MERNDNRLCASRCIHPGEVLKSELVARGIKQKDFAEQIDMRASHLSDFLNGRRSLTPTLASKLEVALGIPSKFWMRMHYMYLQDLNTLSDKDVNKGRDLADVISKAIARCGFTYKQVGDLVGVSESQISAYASGRSYPSLKSAGALCMVLGIAPATMLGLSC